MRRISDQCDTACVNPGVCVANSFGVTMADLCVLAGPGPGRKPGCLQDNSSNAATCVGDGTCMHNVTPCGNFKYDINTGPCQSKCMKDSDCFSNNCQGTKCQP